MPPAAFDADLRHVVNINVGCPDSDSMSDTNLHDSIFCFKVLGVARQEVVDFDTTKNPGIYTVTSQSIHNPITAYPWGMLLVLQRGSILFQFYFVTNGEKSVYRVFDSGTWFSWREFSLDIPSFYKNYATLDSLISAVYGMKPRFLATGSSAADADETGIYTFNTGITGTPFEYGILLVFRYTSAYCVQLAFNISSGHSIAFRNSLTQSWLYLDGLSE